MSEELPPAPSVPRTGSMMNRIVASSLHQRFLVFMMTLLLIGVGSFSLGRLPVDAQGKSVSSQLEELFFSERQPRLPVVCDTHFDDEHDSARIGLRIPDTLFYFAGHFPGRPTLPGVLMCRSVIWAMSMVRSYIDSARRSGLEVLA